MSKLTIRDANGDDMPDLVEMYMDLITYAYPYREYAPKIVFYEIVLSWFASEDRIRIVENDTEKVAFSLVTMNNAGGATDSYLDAEVTYVKEKYRKGRAAHMIYNDVYQFGIEVGLGIMSTSTPDSSPLVDKRFGSKHTFNHYEVPKEVILSINKVN